MKKVFKCEKCGFGFEAKGKKQADKHPLYGSTWRYVADCPACKQTASEDKKPLSKTLKSGENSPVPACATGACPLAN